VNRKRTYPLALAAVLALAPPALADGRGDRGGGARPPHLAALVADIHAAQLSRADRKAIGALVPAVQRNAARRPCRAIKALDAMGVLIGLLKLDPTLSAQISVDALAVRTELLASRRASACGGGLKQPSGAPGSKLGASTPGGLDLTVTLPRATFVPHVVNGTPYVELLMDGMGQAGPVGSPSLPALTQQFAAPPGTTPVVDVLGSTGYDVGGVTLWPRQDQPSDATTGNDPFGDRPFTIDEKAYSLREPFPAAPAATRSLGTLRDLQIGAIEADGAQYMPATRMLHVVTSLRLRVRFVSDGNAPATTFGPASIASGWERSAQSLYASTLVNWATVKANLGPAIRYLYCGEELLVITSAELAPAAETFATARRAGGFATNIVQVGTGVNQIGTTAGQIQAYIRSRLTSNCLQHPSYVAIIGDVNQVPTNLVTSPWVGTDWDGMIATDVPYALSDDSDLLPDLAVGRIPARTLDEANATVAKIVHYETSPPIGASFYSHATVTSFFQGADSTDDRGFTKTSETVATALEADGRSVDRLYTSEAANPLSYYDGTPLPASLRKPAFGWNATTTDLVNDWNAGRFIVFHRDHGAPTFWGNPDFSPANIPSLTNGANLPVVFAVNCASGMFDASGQSLDEQLLLAPSGGAVGVVGDSRDSPSFTNNHIALGMFDAIFPNVLPAYGSASPITRMGDVLVSGKRYMATQNGLDGQDDPTTRADLYLYQWFGDPTMDIRLAAPVLRFWALGVVRSDLASLVLQFSAAAQPAAAAAFNRDGRGRHHHGRTSALAGAWATVFQDGQAVGRAQVDGNGQVTIGLDGTIDRQKPAEVVLDDPSGVPQTIEIPAA
jgi:hypothetical protein